MEKRNMTVKYNLDNINFEKKYTVIIVKDINATDGYDFYSPEEDFKKEERKKCIITYYYKKMNKARNPITIIDNIDGDEFRGRNKIISHFEMNHAIKYSVEMDGLYNL